MPMQDAERRDEKPVQTTVTQLLVAARGGNAEALNQLMPLVYEELRLLAQAKLRFERASHTLNPTALVHEAYFRLVDQREVQWQSRAHFFALAAQAMRRILINYAEKRHAAKRGGKAQKVSLDHLLDGTEREAWPTQAEAILALDAALARLAQFNPRGAQVVEYRFFGGLKYEEIAEVMGLSAITVRRAWTASKAWLRRELDPDEAP